MGNSICSSDLICRSAVIDELREYIVDPNISDDESEIKGYNQGISTAVSVISSFSNDLMWTDCSKCLPVPQELVIVSCHDDSGDTSYDYTAAGWITPDNKFWVVDNDINPFVVAWMPRPDPCRYNEVLRHSKNSKST